MSKPHRKHRNDDWKAKKLAELDVQFTEIRAAKLAIQKELADILSKHHRKAAAS
jgi:hypothetical protein